LHERKWIAGGDARLLSLFPTRVFVAPNILALKSRVVECRSSLLIRVRGLSLGGVPRAVQTIFTCGIGETHCVLVLESLFFLALLLLSLGVLFAPESLLHIDGKQVDVASMVGQRRIIGRRAQLQELCVVLIAAACLRHGRSQADVHIGVILAPQLPRLPVVATIPVLPSFAFCGFILFRQWWRRSAAQYGGASCSVELLGALVSSGFAGGGSLFVGLDARNVGGVVDVP
jgi:hypothetical protein